MMNNLDYSRVKVMVSAVFMNNSGGHELFTNGIMFVYVGPTLRVGRVRSSWKLDPTSIIYQQSL